MGSVIIQDFTTKDPITLMGYEAGTCWGADVKDPEKNYKRGIHCLESDHGRLLEYPQIYMTISGYSARFGREFYTHIGGSPTRLQSSTRRIDYSKGFDFTIPKSISTKIEANEVFTKEIDNIKEAISKLIELGVPLEDATTLFPLAGNTEIVCRTDLRMMVDMAHQRKCSRAYWEYRNFFADFEMALFGYSEQWQELIGKYNIFKRKCEVYKGCPEKDCCGWYAASLNKPIPKVLDIKEVDTVKLPYKMELDKLLDFLD